MTRLEEWADSEAQEYETIYTKNDERTGELIDLLVRFRKLDFPDSHEMVGRAAYLARAFVERNYDESNT